MPTAPTETGLRCVTAAGCVVLPPGTMSAQGAACSVTPLAALGMTETMRREGHRAPVAQTLDPSEIAVYGTQATDEMYSMTPNAA